jgi:hypothetical protein
MNERGTVIPIDFADIPRHELFSSNPPGNLYHYTDLNGLSGIIENKSLWLTKLSYLNDKTELKIAIDRFKTSVNKKLAEIDDTEKKEFLTSASNQLDSFERVNIGVASFCENQDLLSQWRSYGNNGSGVAIEFKADILKQKADSGLINLWRCLYTPAEHAVVINGLIEILLNSYDIIKEIRPNNDEVWEKSKKDLIGYFNTTFSRVAPVIKDTHFYEEREWRLITAVTDSRNPNWCARVSNNRVSQYYNFDFNSIDNKPYKLIKGIIVGPSSNPDPISSAIMVLLRKNDFDFNHITFSQIPLRN